ncbi:MAG: GNAT family N-acetyltransferase [Oscillospiraceae bacterium]|nr:GNAT family N-acetyltransferase [Oscillospiraceae bacterium]
MFRVYGRCFPDYPASKELFAEFLEDARVIRAYDGSNVIGFSVVHKNIIKLLCADGEYGGKGRGSGLLKQSEEYIKSRGHTKIVLGGAINEIFQGVPEDYGAVGFFERRGYRAERTSVNMSLPLETFGAPRTYVPPKPDGVAFRFAEKSERGALITAVKDANKDWLGIFSESKEPVMVAVSNGEIAGFQIVSADGARFLYNDCAIGCVGVVHKARKRGIGLSMVAEGAAYLKKRGRKSVELLYTELEGWYGKLGFKTVSRQWMEEKRL